MIETILSLNHALAILGIGAILVTAFLLYDLHTKQLLAAQVRSIGMHVALILTIGASILTLVYSEYFGILPCGLCWLERMMLYPQIILIGVSFYFKDKLMPRYGIALSAFGFIVSLYHHYIQMGGSQFIKCPAAGEGADCAKRFFFEFGFMTFPLMSAILFALLIALYFYILKVRSN